MRVEHWDARDQRCTPATGIEIKFDSEIWIDDYSRHLYLGMFSNCSKTLIEKSLGPSLGYSSAFWILFQGVVNKG